MKTKLTTKFVENAKVTNGKPFQRFSDGNGLSLVVRASGTKAWEFRFRKPDGRDSNLGLGRYPEITLSEARKKVAEFRKLRAQGLDPSVVQRNRKVELKRSASNTVKQIGEMWLEKAATRVVHKTAEGYRQKLNKHIYPKLGSIPVSEIKAAMLIDAMRPLEKKGKLETVTRTIALFRRLMNYAVNNEYIDHNPIGSMADVFEKPKRGNFACIDISELPDLLTMVVQSTMRPANKLLFEFQLHTLTRSKEATGTRWEEISFEEQIWYLPAERAKNRLMHKIPLTPEVISILKAAKHLCRSSEYVFPSRNSLRKPVHSETVNAAFKRMGLGGKMTSHGTRSLGSTTLYERTDFESVVIEALLSHTDRDGIRDAYNRNKFFQKRKRALEWWSKHVVGLTHGLTSYSTIEL
ncbi:tyrosine-type recombinase/integrase [Vibrio alginolyticus]|uniref:tyrosine-type recombinase/integrase n=1 Tax=Vibrio alginolyticus TaxID=663 RepID=UPI0006A7768F|nr:integrase arm-type DNA-binding domain-containing protein [Vibrio alginolyticus]MCG6322846.1 tyrosine-type recombinase/integrase [Vibrio alginolyticus]MCR9520687.1 tyrosine-type recombinase/integrase [Vibrio alginolyticus]MCS0168063.1 tyrosine-type recombinase/integrase [Vibrio alginolyticus]HCZ9034630.1 integrase arm-type DNA-binding domain-containing protein [Vibrio alginolyticus]HCZ9054093.1 integrase arm-type DNA-binding domain-containing protein [Vibrio alginolyticus]